MFELVLTINLILYGALAQNETLLRVAHNRQTMDVARPIAQSVDVDTYRCRLALPNRFDHLIGSEAFFYDGKDIHGPYLVVDIQSDVDAAARPMEANGIAADTDCPALYHKRGWIFTTEWIYVPLSKFCGIIGVSLTI